MSDINCLSYWYPPLKDAGLPMPKTEIVHMPDSAKRAAYCMLNAEAPARSDLEALDAFCEEIETRASQLGFPAFLRTGHTSGKHEWARTCWLESGDDVDSHVMALVEYSELASLMGLPYDVWAVREMLPTRPIAICTSYGDMPVCREFRFFVNEGDVICWHPYWPLQALADGNPNTPFSDDGTYDDLIWLGNSDLVTCKDLASKAGDVVGGAWSVDILETDRGWYVTDMAQAADSWHWPGCAVAEALGR